jgi:transcriptional regulator with XRE-family HTH domain
MSDEEKKLARSIGESIERLLNSHSMNQNELAKTLGVSESTVGKWVLGKSIPRMGTVQKIADYFGVTKSEILDRSSLKTTPSVLRLSESSTKYSETELVAINSDEKKLLSLWRQASPEGQQAVLAVLSTCVDFKKRSQENTGAG